MSQVSEVIDLKSSPESRGKRLKSLRMMAGLSRKALEVKYSVSASTIQSWEDAKAGGLTEKGAKRAIYVFRQEGIRCSLDWLLYGIGSPPQLSDKVFQAEAPAIDAPVQVNEERAIVNELLAFRQHNPDAIEFIIPDDGMSPLYLKGDYVAGKRRYKENIKNLIGKDCIVETIENEVHFRRLRRGSRDNLYTLICLNPEAGVNEYAQHNIELLSASPVIWHRRKDPSAI